MTAIYAFLSMRPRGSLLWAFTLVLFSSANTLTHIATPLASIAHAGPDRSEQDARSHVSFALQKRGHRSNRKEIADKWYTFKALDGDFKLAFPGKPTREPDSQGPTTLIRTYGLTTQSGMRFSVVFQDVGGDPLARENNAWGPEHELMVADAARKDGERVVQIHRLAKNIVELELRRLVPQTGIDLNYLRRDILRRGRVYTLGCASVDGRELNKPLCQNFFRSMRLTK